MKYVSQRWLGAAAVWLGGLVAPACAEPIIFPDEPSGYSVDDSEASVSLGRPAEASISISDATGSVRMGQSASASLSTGPAQQTQYSQVPPAPGPAATPQISRPIQPALPLAANPFEDSVGFAQTRPNNEILWRMGRTNIDQYGFTGGYTQFNFLAPLFSENGNAVTFINPRIGVTDYGMAMANVGIGHRRYNPGRDRVYGGSFWYDYDNGHAKEFNQLGVSLESLGQYYSLRGNAYFPVGQREALAGFTDGERSFTGNNISVLRNFVYQNAYQVYEGEFAVPMPVLGAYGFDMGVGIYFLNGQSARDATGVSARIQSQITENFWMNGLYTYDKQFESNFSLNFEFTMPDGMARRWFRRPSVKSYLTQSVMRRYRVAAGESHKSSNILGRDTNGNVVTIVYIDPKAPAGGDGTIEHPYQSTSEYAADADPNRYQFVYVRRGSDQQEADYLNTGITLVNYIPSDPSDPGPPVYGQKLIGDVDFAQDNLPLYDVVFGSTLSQFSLPAETTNGTGDKPVLSNFGGTEVVSIFDPNQPANSDGHEIFGLTINGATSALDPTANASGIVTPAGTTTDGFYIHGNTFQNVVNGIVLNSDTTTSPGLDYHEYGRIVDNVFTGTTGESQQAININHVAGDLNRLLVADNTITDFNTGANAGGIFIDAASGTTINGVTPIDPITGDPIGPELGIRRNTISNSSSGIVLTSDDALFATDVDGNIATGTGLATLPGNGFSATATNGGFFDLTTFNNNSFTNYSQVNSADTANGNGAVFDATGGSVILVEEMLSNTFDNNAQDGMKVIADNALVGFASIGNPDPLDTTGGNTFTGNKDDGLDISATNGGGVVVFSPMVNNQFNTNGDNGLVANAQSGGTIAMMIGDPTAESTIGNQFIGNGLLAPVLPENGAGINLSATGAGSVLNVPVLNNTVMANVGNGIRYALDNAAPQDLIYMQGNKVQSNGLNGVAISTVNTDITEIFFDSNAVMGSLGGDGLDITSTDSAIDTITVSQNGLQSNVQHGFDLNLDNSDLATLNVVGNRGGTVLDAGTLGFSYTQTSNTANVMTNSSSDGLDIGRVILNIAATGQGFRPDLTNANGQFLPTDGTDVTTGLSAVNGNLIIAGTDPLEAADGTVIAGGGIPVKAQVLDLTFTDFNTGETLNYDLAHTQLANDTLQNGASLIGSTGTVILNDGRSVTGTFTNTGLQLNQNLAAVGAGISNNGMDGIHLNVTNGSSIGAINIDDNMIQTNNNHGIEIVAAGGSTLPTTGAPIVINNNDILNQVTGDGIRIVNPDTAGTPVGMDVTNNRILSNAGAGVRATVNALSGGITSNLTGNTISNNNSFGVTYTGTQNATVDLNIGGPSAADRNVFDSNVDANIALNLANDAPVNSSLVVQNNLILNARNPATSDPVFGGEGISIFTTNQSVLEDAQILGNMISGNAGEGVKLLANGNSKVHTAGDPTSGGLLVTGNQISDNGLNGIDIRRQGTAVINGVVGSTADMGDYTNTDLVPGISNQITSNGANGLNVATEGGLNATGDAVHIVAGQNLIAGNANNGVNIETSGSSNTRVDLLSNVINGTYTGDTNSFTQQNGINLVTNDVSYFGNVVGGVRGTNSLWDGNIIMNHAQNGIELTRANTGAATSEQHIDIFGNAQIGVISDNGANGIQINDNSNQQVFSPASVSSVMEVNIGDPASLNAPPPDHGAEVPPDFWNIYIGQNGNDAIQVNQQGSEVLLLNVNNVLAMGSKTGASGGRYGLSFNAGDGDAADSRVVSGADTVIQVNYSTFTGFANDGMHVYFNTASGGSFSSSGNSAIGGTLNMLVENSIIGQDETSFNGGDGVDIEVTDNGSNFIFNNNLIQNNQGDGFRMSLHAETLTVQGINRFGVVPNRDSNSPADGVDDTVTPYAPGLVADIINYDPNSPYAHINFVDVTAGLTLTNNFIRFNARDGVQLALGAATSLGREFDAPVTFVNSPSAITLDPRLTSYGHAIVANNDMSGNSRYGFYTLTQNPLDSAAFTPSGARVTAPGAQQITLDPLAHMWLDFENNIGSVLNPTVTGGVYNADPTKSPTTRPIQTNFNVFLNGTTNTFTQAGGGPDGLSAYQRFFLQWETPSFSLQDSGTNPASYGGTINQQGSVNP